MQFCDLHWDILHGMILDRGLGCLVNEEVHALMQAECTMESLQKLNEWYEMDQYDALIDAFHQLSHMAIAHIGNYLLDDRPGGGEYCPMCEVEMLGLEHHQHKDCARSWMAGCSDNILIYCRKNRLLPAPH